MTKRTQRKDVGAWFGGTRGTVQSRMPRSNASDTEAKADAGGGQMEAVRGELGLGAYAAGIGTTAAIGAGVAAVRSGAAARAVNKVTGQTVIIHGTNVKGLKAAGQKLMPNVPPARPEVGKVLFGVTPSPMYGPEEVARIAQHYAAERGFRAAGGKTFSGSAYVAKVPTKALKSEGVTFRQSTSPGKIVSEIPISGSSPNPSKDFVEQLEKAYKRAGGKFPKAPKQKKYKAPKNQPPVRS